MWSCIANSLVSHKIQPKFKIQPICSNILISFYKKSLVSGIKSLNIIYKIILDLKQKINYFNWVLTSFLEVHQQSINSETWVTDAILFKLPQCELWKIVSLNYIYIDYWRSTWDVKHWVFSYRMIFEPTPSLPFYQFCTCNNETSFSDFFSNIRSNIDASNICHIDKVGMWPQRPAPSLS